MTGLQQYAREAMQVEISEKARKQIKKLGIAKQFRKQKDLFLSNPRHPSLDLKQVKGIRGLYEFRINLRYRARIVKLNEQTYYVLIVGDFH